MADEPEPPRKVYGFKDREFKRDNRPASASQAPMPTAKELAMMAGPAAKTAKPAGPKAGDPNDVHAVLQQNRAAEKKFGGDEIEFKPVPSRRKRDYWLLLTLSEVALGCIAILGHGNPFILACAIGGMGLIGLGLTWIMWQVMGKY